MGDDLVWMDLTSLAEEKYPNPKEKWIKIKQDSFDFILFSLEEEYNKDELAEDPVISFNFLILLKS